MQDSGSTTPAVAADEAEARAAYTAAMAQAAAQQQQARVFITDHGGQVTGGHSPVTAAEANH